VRELSFGAAASVSAAVFAAQHIYLMVSMGPVAGGASILLAAWMQLLLADGMFRGRQVIDGAVLSETQSPVISSGTSPVTGQPSFSGLGWSIDTDQFGRHVNHNGVFTSGMCALVDLMPDEDLGIVILANGYPTGIPEGLASAFYELVFTGHSDGEQIDEFNAVMTGAYGQFIATLSESLAQDPVETVAALPASSYVGTYSDEYVGEIEVVEAAGTLVMLTGPGGSTRYPLSHHTCDVFAIAPAPDTPSLLLPVVFTVGPDLIAIELSIALIGGPGHDRLRRVGGLDPG
jgi:hypothetical protein